MAKVLKKSTFLSMPSPRMKQYEAMRVINEMPEMIWVIGQT